MEHIYNPQAGKQMKLVAVMRIKDAMPTIRQCLDSVSRVVDEIIIVDNGSTDGTLSVYREYPKISWVEHTQGLDEPRDRGIMEVLHREQKADWVLFIDSDEVLEEKITSRIVREWMRSTEFSSVWFRHVHLWGNPNTYRVDQRWKPRHRRGMWRVMEGTTMIPNQRTNPAVVYGLKGHALYTDYAVLHYGHLDKKRNQDRQELWRSIDNPNHSDWTGMTYDHMTDESHLELETWNPDAEHHFWGNPSVLFVCMHGLGDNLMFTPAVEAFKKKNDAQLEAEYGGRGHRIPRMEISVMGIGVMEGRDLKTHEIWENNPCIKAYYESSIDHHPSWWDSETFAECDRPVIEEDIRQITQLTQFDEVCLLTLQEDRHLHRIDRFAARLGVRLEDRQMFVFPTASDRRFASMFLSRFCQHGTKLASVHRFCGHPPKSWSFDECEKLCKLLIAEGWTVILWDNDLREAQYESRTIDGVISMRAIAEDLTVNRSAAIISMCDVHIGADSFPMHLACATWIPTIGIFEKTRPHETAPMTDKAVILLTQRVLDSCYPPFLQENAGRIALSDDSETVGADSVMRVVRQMFGGASEMPKLETMQIECGGVSLEVPARDLKGYQHTSKQAEGLTYGGHDEQRVQKAIQQYLQPDWNLIDIGASAGFYSLLASPRCNQVYAFEPNPSVYEILEKNCDGKNITPVLAGLSDYEGTAYLTHESYLSKAQTLLSVPVSVKPLDALGIKADMVKIDVEGLEDAVLRGGRGTLAKTRVVLVETHPKHGIDIWNVFQELESMGFKVQALSQTHLLGIRDPLTLPGFSLNCIYDEAERMSHINWPGQMAWITQEYPQLLNNPLKWFECVRTFGHIEAQHQTRLRILDIGGGYSVFPFYLASLGHTVISIDPDEGANRAKAEIIVKDERFAGLTLYNGTIFDLIPDTMEEFDVILCFSVVEHITNDTETLLETAKYLNEGGVMVVTTDFYDRYIEYPNANREIVTDKISGHCESRIYDKNALYERIINPLGAVGVNLIGDTDFENVDFDKPEYRAVRGMYTFARMYFKKGESGSANTHNNL